MSKLEIIRQYCIVRRNSLQIASDTNTFEDITSTEAQALIRTLDEIIEEIDHIENSY